MNRTGANNAESIPQWMPDVCQTFINSKNFKECYDEAIEMEPDPGSEPDLKLELHCKVLCAKSTGGQTLDSMDESYTTTRTAENTNKNISKDIPTDGSNPAQNQGCLEDELSHRESSETLEQFDYRYVLNHINGIDNNPNLTLIAKEREKYNLIKRFREAYPNSAYQFPEQESDNYDSQESDSASILMDEEQLPVKEADRYVNTTQTHPKTCWTSPDGTFERELGHGESPKTSETGDRNVIRDRIEYVEKLLQGCQVYGGYDKEDFGTLEEYDYRVVLNYINHIENDTNLTFIHKEREKYNIIKQFRKAYPNSAHQFPETASDGYDSHEFDSSPIMDDRDLDGNNAFLDPTDAEFSDSLENERNYSQNEAPKSITVQKIVPKAFVQTTSFHDSIEADDAIDKSVSSIPRDSIEISVGKVSIRINSSHKLKPPIISSNASLRATRDSLESFPHQSEVSEGPIVQRESQPQRDVLRRIVRGLMIQRINQNAEMEADRANSQAWFDHSEPEPGDDTILEIELLQTGRADNAPSLFSTPIRTRPGIILEVQTSPISPRTRMRSFVEGGTRVFNDSDSFGSYEDSSITRWREQRFPPTAGGATINQEGVVIRTVTKLR